MTGLFISYIVPTKDRPEDLATLLTSLAEQTRPADQIIVVDGSDPSVEPVVDRFSSLNVTYIQELPPSLSRQRNAGVRALAADAQIVGFLDDDLVLEANATEQMIKFWDNAEPNVGGAGFAIRNQPRAFANRLSKLFLIDSPQPGRILASGFQSQIPPLTDLTQTEWLYGGATVWRRDVVETFHYDEWYIGHGYLEDVDFSYRVGQAYKLFVVGEAGVDHNTRPVRTSAQFMIGRQQIINRLYFTGKLDHISYWAFGWAMFGQLIFNLGSSFRHMDGGGLRRLAGNVMGLFESVFNRRNQIGGFYK